MSERTPFAIDDLYQLGWLEDPRWSPDGRWIAFVRVSVDRAGGVKCARCWRYVPSVRTEPEWEGICDRCVEALGGTAAA